MSKVEIHSIPDGRIRNLHVLTEEQKAKIRAITINGLRMLIFKEMEMAQPETWIEYWIDEDKVTEDEIRTQINRAILNS